MQMFGVKLIQQRYDVHDPLAYAAPIARGYAAQFAEQRCYRHRLLFWLRGWCWWGEGCARLPDFPIVHLGCVRPSRIFMHWFWMALCIPRFKRLLLIFFIHNPSTNLTKSSQFLLFQSTYSLSHSPSHIVFTC